MNVVLNPFTGKFDFVGTGVTIATGDARWLKLDQSTPQTLSGGAFAGSGLLKLTTGLLGVDTNTYLTSTNGIYLNGALTSGFMKWNGSSQPSQDTSTYITGNQSITLSGDTTGSGATSITTTTAKSTNLKGGNGTTLLGSIPYQSNTDTTLFVNNITTTKKFLRMTGDGTNGGVPAFDTVTKTDVGLSNVDNTSDASKNIGGSSATCTGNAGTVTNGVYTTGNQSIAGIKTFSDATEASSATVGGTIISGGLAVAKRVYATDMTVTNKITGSISGNCDGSAGTASTAANLSGTPALPNGTTATTQSQADNSTKLSTTAYVDTGLGTKVKSDGSVNPTNLLSNGDFENWSAGTSAAPDRWTAGGNGGLSVAREASIIKLGTYSVKLSGGNSDTNDNISQDISATKGINYWKGRTISLGIWIYSSVASTSCFSIYDGVGQTFSAYHPGDATWHFLTVTMTISASANQLLIYLRPSNVGGNTSAYFDGAMCVEGESAFAFSPAPVNPIANSTTLSVFTAASGPVGAQTAIQGWIAINVAGTQRFIPYW